jgi:lysozyme family protein
MTDDQIIDAIIVREGGFVNDRVDRGGATKFGITAKTLGAWRGYGHSALPEEVRQLSVHEAREIYRQQYIVQPGFAAIDDDGLRAQLVDDGVLSGPATAIRSLQAALGLTPDGFIGPITTAAANRADVATLRRKLAVARALRLARIVQKDTTQARFLVGWLTRTLGFLEA